MRKVIDYVKEYKKIILVVILIAILLGAVLLIDRGKDKKSSTVSTTSKSSTELKLTQILTNIEGVGEADVMINENEDEIFGVIIVCQGANNLMTRSNILNAVSTALKIDKKLIAIYSMSI